MNKQKKIAFLGGDARQRFAAERLAQRGANISFFGSERNFFEGIEYAETIEAALVGAEVIVLPLPCSTDGKRLNAPFIEGESIALDSLMESLAEKSLVIGGRITDFLFESAKGKNIRIIDYFLSEEFQIKNAYTTAEAALSVAMNNLRKNIRGARFAITGFGRIGRSLAGLLQRLGAKVCVLARRDSELCWAQLLGADTVKLDCEGIKSLQKGYDIIFNTVPEWIFFESFLINMDKKTKLIDLASAPGGVDVSSAKRLGASVLWASSLPGKYAPESAGELIADCVGEILAKEGVLYL